MRGVRSRTAPLFAISLISEDELLVGASSFHL